MMKKLWQNLKSGFISTSQNHDHKQISNSNQDIKILIITPYAPYPIYTGGATRVFEKIRYFGLRHRLTVVSFYGSRRNKEKIRKMLEPYCENLILVKRGWPYIKFSAKIPDKVKSVSTRKMWGTLIKLTDANYDLVLFEYIFTAPYRQLFESSYTVIEEHNIESTVLEQYAKYEGEQNKTDTYAFIQARLLRDFEKENWPLFNLRTTVSQVDYDQMKLRSINDILVVENGTNIKEIIPVEYQPDGKILFMGHMSYTPNVEAVIYFVRDIFPILLKHDPDLVFCIAGSEPAAEVMALVDNKHVECIADPENMSTVAKHCSISVIPLFLGSGTRIKILHAMAMGLPVVSTRLGCQGLSVIDGEHLLIRDEAESFAQAVLEIRKNNDLRDNLRMKGRMLVEQKYDWEKLYSSYEKELLQRLQCSKQNVVSR